MTFFFSNAQFVLTFLRLHQTSRISNIFLSLPLVTSYKKVLQILETTGEHSKIELLASFPYNRHDHFMLLSIAKGALPYIIWTNFFYNYTSAK